jgi:hypothetical protein
VRYSAEDAHCEGIAAAEGCLPRGIDVEDSVAATRKTFAALDIPCISVETVADLQRHCDKSCAL